MRLCINDSNVALPVRSMGSSKADSLICNNADTFSSPIRGVESLGPAQKLHKKPLITEGSREVSPQKLLQALKTKDIFTGEGLWDTSPDSHLDFSFSVQSNRFQCICVDMKVLINTLGRH